jgi:hypothetical protein
LIANSPLARFPAVGAADAVELLYSEIGVKPVAAIRRFLLRFLTIRVLTYPPMLILVQPFLPQYMHEQYQFHNQRHLLLL